MKSKKVLAKGIVEKIGLSGSFLQFGNKKISAKISNHHDALKLVVSKGLITTNSKLLTINSIGHRVVHGGEYFSDAVRINADVIQKIKSCCDLAPLHNPANLAGILACSQIFPKLPQVAVFDTAFFASMKPANYIYPIPYKFYEKNKIRRYGFHGTSHKFVYQRLIEMLNSKFGMLNKKNNSTFNIQHSKSLKVITCHIGNGASMTAIDAGRVVETSMGFTPLEGLMMGTRSGNIDPAVVTYMIRKLKLTADQIDDILNKQSGLLGVSGLSSDMREIIAGAAKGNKKCKLALEIYINSIVKYIGAYTALMGGVDAIILTAGVMERSKIIREILIKRLARLGIKLDASKNDFESKEAVISTNDSKVKVIVIPTDEELEIANETMKLIK